MSTPNEPEPTQPAGDALALVASWLFVGIPAAWGISQVVMKSLALFR